MTSGHDVGADLRAGTDPWVMAPSLGQASIGSMVVLDDATLHHLRRVRRVAAGARVVATDGRGVVAGGRLGRDGLEVEAMGTIAPSRPRVRVVQGLAKRSRHDEVMRMLTELGVDWITAATTERCQVDLGHKVDRVHARWESIVASACGQARRAHRPIVDGPLRLVEALPGSLQRVLVAHPGATTNPLEVLAGAGATTGHDEPDDHVWTAVIGPEGGLSDDEVTDLVTRGAVAVGLGPTVLRTEHAGLALAAIMAAGLGRM